MDDKSLKDQVWDIFCQEAGADFIINYKIENLVRSILGSGEIAAILPTIKLTEYLFSDNLFDLIIEWSNKHGVSSAKEISKVVFVLCETVILFDEIAGMLKNNKAKLDGYSFVGISFSHTSIWSDKSPFTMLFHQDNTIVCNWKAFYFGFNEIFTDLHKPFEEIKLNIRGLSYDDDLNKFYPETIAQIKDITPKKLGIRY